MPTTFIYGNEDWMDFRHALRVAPDMSNVRVSVVEDAGHHLYLDNPHPFNQVVLAELKGGKPRSSIVQAEYVYLS
jgi:cardiolipin-specific phospholipase